MILPIFNSLEELNPSLVNASRDLGASNWQTFTKVILPLTMAGVKAGYRPSLFHRYPYSC